VAGATLIAAPIALASGGRLLPPSAAALVTVALLALWLTRRLGGMTGDAYGAAIEMAEVAFLVAAGAL
jgi:adenosylcobinamide-GDP ribazoletransferase